jgi:(+)-trans-carveol dehydrogenase
MDGKVVLITGGARGQGRAHAIRLAEEGADIIVTDLCSQLPEVTYPMGTREELDETVRLVEKLDRRCLSYVADAGDAARMREVMDLAVAEFGHLDTVVINHGISVVNTLEDDAADHNWDVVMEHNLSAVWRTARAAIPHLRERGGSIIVTASGAGLVPLFNNPSYVAAKHGVIGLVKALAADLAQDWIRVNAVCPTTVPTPLFINDVNVRRFNPGNPNATVADMEFPSRSLNLLPVPWIEPEAVSHAVLYLASDEAKYVTGIALPVDAGQTTQPPGITPLIGQRLAELS